MVDLPSSPLAEVDTEFEKLAVEGAAFTFGLPGTSVREKLLQNLAADVCRSQLGLAFRMHVTAAHMHAISYADLKAAIRFVAPYSGYPAAADALAQLNQLAAEIKLNTSDLGDQPVAGNDSPAESLHSTDDWMSRFLQWQTSLGLLIYVVLAWAMPAAFVRWYEEPTLLRQFGAEYLAYRRAVPATN